MREEAISKSKLYNANRADSKGEVAGSDTVVNVKGKVNLLGPDGRVVAQEESVRSGLILMGNDSDRVVHKSEVNTGG